MANWYAWIQLCRSLEQDLQSRFYQLSNLYQNFSHCFYSQITPLLLYWEVGCKPGPVTASGDNHVSGIAVTSNLKRPTRES